jgi:hypothetical protein
MRLIIFLARWFSVEHTKRGPHSRRADTCSFRNSVSSLIQYPEVHRSLAGIKSFRTPPNFRLSQYEAATMWHKCQWVYDSRVSVFKSDDHLQITHDAMWMGRPAFNRRAVPGHLHFEIPLAVFRYPSALCN